MASLATWDDPVALWDDPNYDWDGNFLGASESAPGPGTGTVGRLIDVLTEIYLQQSNVFLIDSGGTKRSLYSLIKGPVNQPFLYQRVEFKSGPKTISLILSDGNRQTPPLYTVASPWHG